MKCIICGHKPCPFCENFCDTIECEMKTGEHLCFIEGCKYD